METHMMDGGGGYSIEKGVETCCRKSAVYFCEGGRLLVEGEMEKVLSRHFTLTTYYLLVWIKSDISD